jgi:hypothetical protein
VKINRAEKGISLLDFFSERVRLLVDAGQNNQYKFCDRDLQSGFPARQQTLIFQQQLCVPLQMQQVHGAGVKSNLKFYIKN